MLKVECGWYQMFAVTHLEVNINSHRYFLHLKAVYYLNNIAIWQWVILSYDTNDHTNYGRRFD